jgi:hypothetical protein
LKLKEARNFIHGIDDGGGDDDDDDYKFSLIVLRALISLEVKPAMLAYNGKENIHL